MTNHSDDRTCAYFYIHAGDSPNRDPLVGRAKCALIDRDARAHCRASSLKDVIARRIVHREGEPAGEPVSTGVERDRRLDRKLAGEVAHRIEELIGFEHRILLIADPLPGSDGNGLL